MTFDPGKHHRRSIRLRGHDYAGGGAYFVTACVQGKEFLFGEIVASEMLVNEIGLIVQRNWDALPGRFPSLVLDAFQIMPNHLHAVLVIPGPGLEPALAHATGAPVIHPTPRATVGPGLAPAFSLPRLKADGITQGKMPTRTKKDGATDKGTTPSGTKEAGASDLGTLPP